MLVEGGLEISCWISCLFDAVRTRPASGRPDEEIEVGLGTALETRLSVVKKAGVPKRLL
jgi:hypothetical protein